MRRTQSAIDWIRLILFSALLLAISGLASGQEVGGDDTGAEVVEADPVPGGGGEAVEEGQPGSDGEVTPEEPPTPRLVRTSQHILRQIEALQAEVSDLEQYLEQAGFFSGSLEPTHWMKTTRFGLAPPG